MKYKTLINKDSQEFGCIIRVVDIDMFFTSTQPVLLPETATFEGLKSFYETSPHLINKDFMITLNNYEVIELDVFETDTVGADIRNKLSPIKNLLSMLSSSQLPCHHNPKINKLIEQEIKQAEECVKYIAELL